MVDSNLQGEYSTSSSFPSLSFSQDFEAYPEVNLAIDTDLVFISPLSD